MQAGDPAFDAKLSERNNSDDRLDSVCSYLHMTSILTTFDFFNLDAAATVTVIGPTRCMWSLSLPHFPRVGTVSQAGPRVLLATCIRVGHRLSGRPCYNLPLTVGVALITLAMV